MEFIDIFTLIITTVSLILSIITILVHLKLKEMLNHPGHLVFLQCIFQMVVDVHWYTSINELSFISANEDVCVVVGAVAVGASSAFFSYLLALSVELQIKLKNSTKVTYRKRNLIYHVYAFCVAATFSTVGVFTSQFGISDMETCSFKDGKSGRYAYWTFILVNIFMVWVILISIWRELRNNVSSLMVNYVMVIISVSITMSIAQVMELLEHLSEHNGTYKKVGIVFGSMTGSCIALARLSNKSLLQRLYVRVFYNPRRQWTDTMLSMVSLEDIGDEEIIFLGDFFDSITKKVNPTQIIFQILAMIYLRYEEPASEAYVYDGNIRYTDYKFEEEFIEKVVNPAFGNVKFQKDCLKKKIIREYMPLEFLNIRELSGVKNKDLQRSMMLHMNNFNVSRMEGGSSEAFIFTTFDEKFVVKTINSSERRLFLRILGKYTERIFGCKDSKLIRIFGLYKLLPENQDFIIMENIIPNKESALIFDLKGSLIDRRVSVSRDNKKSTVLKDQNLYEKNLKIVLAKNEIQDLVKVLEEDFEMLRAENIMDYSLLVAFYTNPPAIQTRYLLSNTQETYSLGVIDILQEYNFAKISEEKIKKIYKKNKSMLSVAEPTAYYKRILEFLSYLFTETNP